MMARATRLSVGDAKRKAASELVDGESLLGVLEAEDTLGLLDRIFPLPASDQTASIRALLRTPAPLQHLKAAIAHLRPLSHLPRASLSPTAAEQLRFCSLALSLLDQLSPPPDLRLLPAALPLPPASPPRPPPALALLQHLPSADYWSSLAHSSSVPENLDTANAELVAVLPTPSDSALSSVPTLASFSKKPLSQKTPLLPQSRKITTGAFLDYGPFSSFAPSFDQDGELVGRNQLGQVLWQREEKTRLQHAITREHQEGTPSVVHPSQDENQQDPQPPSDLQFDDLLPPEDIDAINAALHDFELEKSVQVLLARNQRALQRLEELQFQRLTKHPASSAQEGSEEWDTAQAILDSLTLLTSLRPRSSSRDQSPVVPPPSILHKLHRSLALEPSPGWHGTLPAGRTTALHDDSTIKVRPGVATPAPVVSTPATSTAAVANTFTPYSYPYNAQQQQAYRAPQATAYAPYKSGQVPSYYQGYAMPTATAGQQQAYYPQAYATGTSNQQPYGATAATSQQPYPGAYSTWYGQQYPTLQSTAGGSGRGTPQPVAPTPTSYNAFFNTAATAGTTPAAGARTPAIANTVAAASSAYPQPAGAVPTYVRNPPTMINGSPAPFYNPYPVQPQPAR